MICANFAETDRFAHFSFLQGGVSNMRVTIDLDRDIIIIPDNFFKKIKDENEKLEKYGAAPVKAIDRIKKSFEIAMADTDNRLMTQSNAKTKRVTAKVVVESVESKAAEQPAAAEVKK